ncbi:hypothetical protein [Streptomyces umbrinus]|uniref:hypothetical protein n=1 Tax=Streptomyces umbrinus TaxID=67370 RepID=UPI003430A9A9
MRYAVIATDGELTHHDGEIDWDAVIGPEGQSRVRLHPGLAVTGWVNDVGLLHPETYPRNIAGSCVLAAFGASVQPYAGPVVITGWNADNTARGLLEICPLPDPVDTLDTVHTDVLRALAGDAPSQLSPSWAEQMREVADHVRTAETPGITIRTVTLR